MSVRRRAVLFRAIFIPLWAISTCTITTSTARGEPREKAQIEQEGEPRPFDSQGVVIEDIQVQVEKGVREKVLIHSKAPFSAKPFVMEGEKPRLVIDIPNTLSLRKSFRSLEVGGEFIKDIRAHHQKEKGTLRVVLDLYPNKNYRVNQSYFEAQNTYVIEVEKE